MAQDEEINLQCQLHQEKQREKEQGSVFTKDFNGSLEDTCSANIE